MQKIRDDTPEYQEAWIESPQSGSRTITEGTEYQKCIFHQIQSSIFNHLKVFKESEIPPMLFSISGETCKKSFSLINLKTLDITSSISADFSKISSGDLMLLYNVRLV